jgi:hypothetical protein
MKRIFINSIILLISTNCIGQDLEDKTKISNRYSFGLTTGYVYQNDHYFQLGGIVGSNYGNVHVGSKGAGLGTEFNFKDDKFTIGAKAFVEYNYFVISGFRLNLINYFRNSQTDLRITTEFGFSIFGFLNILYGYGYPILKNEFIDLSRHRLTITLNLVPDNKK